MMQDTPLSSKSVHKRPRARARSQKDDQSCCSGGRAALTLVVDLDRLSLDRTHVPKLRLLRTQPHQTVQIEMHAPRHLPSNRLHREAAHVGLARAFHERRGVVGRAEGVRVVDEVDERDRGLEEGGDPLGHLAREAVHLRRTSKGALVRTVRLVSLSNCQARVFVELSGSCLCQTLKELL
jgi:hypothetical protein